MPIWSSATITRFQLEGEKDVARKLNCVLSREALNIVADTATYAIAEEAFSISRITWKGTKIDPLSFRDKREIYDTRGGVSSKPDWYLYDNQGRNTITFFPTPSANVPSAGQTALFSTHIPTAVIVEICRIPDSDDFLIPLYVRRRLLKYYVLWKCFAIEGKGQNLKNAQAFEQRYNDYVGRLKKIHQGHFMARRRTLSPVGLGGMTPRGGVLPSNYGRPGEF